MADQPIQHAESVRPPNRCEQAHQMHLYEDHYQMGQGFYVEKCRTCGLTRGEVKARQSDGTLHPAACGPRCRSQHTDDHSGCEQFDGRDDASEG
jgi:hypothetical protein